MRRPMFSRHAAILGLSVLIAPVLAPTARAQHTPDPYNIVGEYNLGYQDYMYANYPNGVGFTPNQGVLQGRSGVSRANQFQSYLEEIDGVGNRSDSFIPSGRGRGGIEPYYRAHRQFDEAFNRVYAPNEAADKTYNADKNERTKKYIEYLKESDPKKRAQLYRAYNQASLRAVRDSGSGSTRAAFRSGTPERSATTGTASGSTPARRPSSVPAPSGRSRATATAPDSSSETPEQVLERAKRSATPSRRPAPAPAPR